MSPVQQNEATVKGEISTNEVRQRMFEKVENVADLEPILKERLPISAHVFNACKNHSNWSDQVTWYVLGGEISWNSWIISTFMRNDFGQEICVSRPTNGPITPEVQEAFSNTSFIDWSKPFIFIGIELEISDMVANISVHGKGNCTYVHPCSLYYMDIDEGLQLNDKFDHGDGVEVKSIDNDKGNDFILKTWKYATDGSIKYVSDCLARNPSAGTYVDGQIVSGIVFAVHGLISMLYTLNDHRGKGYALSAMHLLMKQSAERGFFPVSAAEQRNESSKTFHLKSGLKFAGFVAYVRYEKTGF